MVLGLTDLDSPLVAASIATASEEVLSFVVSEPTATQLESAELVNADLLARGVVIRQLVLEALLGRPALRAYLIALTEAGGLVRSAARLPVRFASVDEDLAVVASNEPGPAETGSLVTTPAIVTALVALFESAWERATPFTPADTPAVTAPVDRQEQDVLTLLARGLRDEAIAEHLGLSVRTVRRLVAGLSVRTSSETRFELGVKASRFGWV